MSKNNSVRRCRTWKFSHTLYTSILPEARSAGGLHPASTIDPFVLFTSLFDNLFKQGPETVIYIHLRVSRTAYEHCVSCGKTGAALPALPFTGFIQASSTVSPSILRAWLDATWTPVGSKLRCDQQYQDEFLVPHDAAFVYFLVRGEPALGAGGRGRRKPKAPNATFDPRVLAPGLHGPAALPAAAGAAGPPAAPTPPAGAPAAPSPPVRAVPSALPVLRSRPTASRRSGYLCSRSPKPARPRQSATDPAAPNPYRPRF